MRNQIGRRGFLARTGGGGGGPVISNFSVNTGTQAMSANFSAAGTAYYVFDAGSTPLPPATIESTATGLGQSITIVDGLNTGSLTNYPTANGTYYMQMVLKVGGVYSNVVVSDAIVISAYAYTWVDNNGTGRWSDGTPGSVACTKIECAFAVKIQAWLGTNNFVESSTKINISIDHAGGDKLKLVLKDNAGTTVYSGTSTETFALDTPYDFYIGADLSGPTLTVKSNGTALTMSSSISAGSGSFKTNELLTFLRDSANTVQADTKIAYMWFDFRTSALLGSTSFYDGGPKDLSGLATPDVWRGHHMTADAEDGDTGHGWNDLYNKGSLSVTAVTATFTDTV